MRRFAPLLRTRTAAVAAVLAVAVGAAVGPAAGRAEAATTYPVSINYDLMFQTQGQTLPEFGARSGDIVPTLSWNDTDTADSKDCLLGACFGGKLTGFTRGQLGLGYRLQHAGGTVSVNFPVSVNMEARQVSANTIDLLTRWRGVSGAQISTTSTTGSLALTGSFGVRAGFGGEVCLVDCWSDSSLLSATIPTASGTIFSVSGPVGLPVVGPGISGTLGVPDLLAVQQQSTDGSSVTATGHTTFGDVTVNMAQWANMATGNPIPLSGKVGYHGIDFGYNLVTLGLHTVMFEDHQLRFRAQEISATLETGVPVTYSINGGAPATGTTIAFRVGDAIRITLPAGADVSFTPSFSLTQNAYSYDSHVVIPISGTFKTMSVNATIHGEGIKLGPVWKKDFGSIPVPPVPNVHMEGQLSGFHTASGAPFTLGPSSVQ